MGFYFDMKGKTSFRAYCDWIDTFEELSNEEAGKLVKHLFRYVNDLDPEAPDRVTKLLFAPIRATLKRDLKKWLNQVEANKANGSKGGRPKKQTEAKKPNGLFEKRNNPKKGDRDSDRDRDSVTDRDKKIENRKNEFKNSLSPFLEKYGKDMLNDFFEYWTEHGYKDKKMRFEKERSFGLSRRLSTWSKNQKKWQKEKSSAKKEKPKSRYDEFIGN